MRMDPLGVARSGVGKRRVGNWETAYRERKKERKRSRRWEKGQSGGWEDGVASLAKSPPKSRVKITLLCRGRGSAPAANTRISSRGLHNRLFVSPFYPVRASLSPSRERHAKRGKGRRKSGLSGYRKLPPLLSLDPVDLFLSTSSWLTTDPQDLPNRPSFLFFFFKRSSWSFHYQPTSSILTYISTVFRF